MTLPHCVLLIHLSDDLCRVFDLAENTELRSICLDSFGWIYPGAINFASCFPSILSTITSHTVEEITICLEHPVLEALKLHEWEFMASLFAAPRFSTLGRIHFRVFGLTGMDDKALERFIEEKLWQCASRGILSLETGTSRANPLLPGKILGQPFAWENV